MSKQHESMLPDLRVSQRSVPDLKTELFGKSSVSTHTFIEF